MNPTIEIHRSPRNTICNATDGVTNVLPGRHKHHTDQHEHESHPSDRDEHGTNKFLADQLSTFHKNVTTCLHLVGRQVSSINYNRKLPSKISVLFTTKVGTKYPSPSTIHQWLLLSHFIMISIVLLLLQSIAFISACNGA